LVVYIIYINDPRSSKYQIMKYICWLKKEEQNENWRGM